jgi:hypothetical protein
MTKRGAWLCCLLMTRTMTIEGRLAATPTAHMVTPDSSLSTTAGQSTASPYTALSPFARRLRDSIAHSTTMTISPVGAPNTGN